MKANIVAEPSVYHQLVPLGTLRKRKPRKKPEPAVRSSIQATTPVPPSTVTSPIVRSSSVVPGFGAAASGLSAAAAWEPSRPES